MLTLTILLTAFFSVPAAAEPSRKCFWSDDGTFYGAGCDFMNIRNSFGHFVASLGEIMRFNPAVLPTKPTPLGAEFNFHSKGQGPQESTTETQLIKGLNFFGLGLSTWNTGSMVGPDLASIYEGGSYETKFRNYEAQIPSRTGYRFGGSLQLPFSSLKHGFRARVGLAFGAGKVTRENSNSLGVAIDLLGAHFGWSSVKDDLSPSTLPGIETKNFSVGYSLGPVHLGYNYAKVSASVSSSVNSLLSFRYSGEIWNVFGSLKTYTTALGVRKTWESLSLHRNFGDKFSVGYLYGLYRGSHSVSLQLYY